MALKRFNGTLEYAFNDSTKVLHLVTVDGAGEVTDLGALSAGSVTTSGTVTEASAASILAATQTNLLALSDPIALTASVTLATMLGTALNTSLKVLTITPSDTTKVVNWAMGKAATAATAVMPAQGMSLRITKTVADTLQFYAASSVNITITQEG